MKTMRVKKVEREDSASTYCCISRLLPDQSPFVEGLPESRDWVEANLGKHVEGYHLQDGDKVVGHIYFAASEDALIPYEVEPRVACIYCTYLFDDYLNKGYGRMMFEYMKRDLGEQRLKGIMIPATDFKEWMHYELFLKQGFKIVKKHPPYKVMYFPLKKKEAAIRVLDLNYTPSKEKVEVTLFRNSFCPVSPYMYNLVKKVAQCFGDQVKIVEIEATVESVRRYGTTDPLINGKIKFYGPASEEEIGKAIQEEITPKTANKPS